MHVRLGRWLSEREDLGRRWIYRARSLEENGAGPSGGGGGERGIFNHRGRGLARWAFRVLGSGGD